MFGPTDPAGWTVEAIDRDRLISAAFKPKPTLRFLKMMAVFLSLVSAPVLKEHNICKFMYRDRVIGT